MPSILDRISQSKQKATETFIALGGTRLAGKTTLAGTLKGKTLILQPANLESGAQSAVAMAEEKGNHVDVLTLNSYEDSLEVLKDPAILDYDNIFYDGVSAFTEQLSMTEKFTKLKAVDKNGIWDAFRFIKEELTKVIVELKTLASTHGKVVFITYALRTKHDADGNLVSADIDAQGNGVKDLVEGKAPHVIVAYSEQTDLEDPKSEIHRVLLTRNAGPFSARVNSLLDHQNPGKCAPDLNELVALIRGTN